MKTTRDIVLTSALACGVLSACTVGGSRSPGAENDRLRREVLDLRTRVTALEGERDELKAKLHAPPGSGLAGPGALAALPVCTAVRVDSLSGLRSAGQGGGPRMLAVMFSTRDGRDRFTQVVGTARVEATFLAPGAEAAGAAAASAPVRSVALDAAGLRDAYRSGITGTYYEAVLPLPEGFVPGAGASIAVRVVLHDAVTGADVRGEQIIPAR